jgi:hypothetical protein
VQCAEFLKGEAIVSVTEAKFKRCDSRGDSRAGVDVCILDSSILHRTYIQPSTSLDKDGSNIDSSIGPIRRHRGVWLGFNGDVSLEIAYQSVACSGTEVIRFDNMFGG